MCWSYADGILSRPRFAKRTSIFSVTLPVSACSILVVALAWPRGPWRVASGTTGTVTGIDPTPAFVARAEGIAQAEGIANVTFAVGDGRSLRFQGGQFDTAIAITVLSHLPRRERVLAELVRVVRRADASW